MTDSSPTPETDARPQRRRDRLRRPRRRRPSRRGLASAGSLAVMAGACALALLVPVPYAVYQPGPTANVLGEFDDEPVISIDGTETHPTEGTLALTTIAVSGGPGYPVRAADVVAAWVGGSDTILPREAVFPEDATAQSEELQNAAMMASSQHTAAAAALTELGIDFASTVRISGVAEDAAAAGALQAGDEILAVDGTTVTDIGAAQQAVANSAPGEPLDLTIQRDGETREVTAPTAAEHGSAVLGIVLVPGYDFPFEIDISVGAIGGSSAGTMLALGVYDELTPGALTGGEQIAGTGTMSEDGRVGPIGGIAQKMVAAESAGSEFFLAPAENCDQVAGHVPEGLSVVRIATLDQAVDAVETIAASGSTGDLPDCASPDPA